MWWIAVYSTAIDGLFKPYRKRALISWAKECGGVLNSSDGKVIEAETKAQAKLVMILDVDGPYLSRGSIDRQVQNKDGGQVCSKCTRK